MPINIAAFLIAIFQFFHFGGNQLIAAPSLSTHTSIFSTNHSLAFHNASTPLVVRSAKGEEETVDTEQDFSQALKNIPEAFFIKRIFFPATVNKSFFVVKNNSFSCKTHLFVLHCNFRV